MIFTKECSWTKRLFFKFLNDSQLLECNLFICMHLYMCHCEIHQDFVYGKYCPRNIVLKDCNVHCTLLKVDNMNTDLGTLPSRDWACIHSHAFVFALLDRLCSCAERRTNLCFNLWEEGIESLGLWFCNMDAGKFKMTFICISLSLSLFLFLFLSLSLSLSSCVSLTALSLCLSHCPLSVSLLL